MVAPRTHALPVRQTTVLANAVCAHLAEFGIIAPQEIERMAALVARVLGLESDEFDIPPLVRSVVDVFNAQLDALQAQIVSLETKIKEWGRTNDDSRGRAAIPGVGLTTASALAHPLKMRRNLLRDEQWLCGSVSPQGKTLSATRRASATP